MKSAVFLRSHARWASSKITTWSYGAAAVPHALVAEVVDVLNERLDPLADDALALAWPTRANSSRVSASCSTVTRGPFPDR